MSRRRKPRAAAPRRKGAAGARPAPRRESCLKRLWRLSVLGFFLALAFVLYANSAPVWHSAGRIHDDPESVPPGLVAVVFGTTDTVAGGRPNRYFHYRIDAAALLWRAGKIKTIIVSGDKSSKYYDEPARMKKALVAKGVPADRIVEDPVGLRTLDSVGRASDVFGLERVLFISQRFQNERALYLAGGCGLDAHAFNARDVGAREGAKVRLREVAARVRMWLDVHLLGTQPNRSGPPIPLPE